MVANSTGRILVCTPSNKAVDEILSRVVNKGLIGHELSGIVRVGSAEYQGEPSVRSYGLDHQVNLIFN
jgi:hypothetical protein